MNNMIKAIKNAFPDFDESQYTGDLMLGDIPDWDSMNSVNFLNELEDNFNVDLNDIILNGNQTLSDVAAIIKNSNPKKNK